MLSKWQIWDFFAAFEKDFLKSYQGKLALNTFDPICLKMVKDYLFKAANSRIIHHKTASEITRSWIEEEFQTLSLFGNTDSFYIHQAQDLGADLLELIAGADVEGRFVILSFETDGATWKKILKESKLDILQIEAPKFWEIHKLLDFVCSYLRLSLGYEAKNWILSTQENELANFYNCCSLIRLNYPAGSEVSLVQVQELLTAERLDQFGLANLFVRKKYPEFFDKLLVLQDDFERARGFFMFMQGHLIKLADVSYLAQKPKLTSYDKDLQNASKLWKNSDVLREVSRFNRWELMSKKKDFLLWHELKNCQLRSRP